MYTIYLTNRTIGYDTFSLSTQHSYDIVVGTIIDIHMCVYLTILLNRLRWIITYSIVPTLGLIYRLNRRRYDLCDRLIFRAQIFVRLGMVHIPSIFLIIITLVSQVSCFGAPKNLSCFDSVHLAP